MEQKRLKRFWVRTRLVLLAAAVFLWSLARLLLTTTLPQWAAIALFVAGCLSLLAIAVVSSRFLRCTYCGKGIAVGFWNPRKEPAYCKHCGKPFLFDDDPPDKAETTTKEEP